MSSTINGTNELDSLRQLNKITDEVVIDSATDYIVWIDNKNQIKCDINPAKRNVYARSICEFNKMSSFANVHLKGSQLISFNKRLGAALADALSHESAIDVLEKFKPLENYVNSVIASVIKTKYLIFTSLASILLTMLAFVLQQYTYVHWFVTSALIVVGAGFLGTLISVIERSNSLILNDGDSIQLILSQALIRVVLGGLFGLVAYTASILGIAFTIFKDTVPCLILLGIGAGFSERLIPDLIQGFSADQYNKKVDKNE